jgi:hypothetical protein
MPGLTLEGCNTFRGVVTGGETGGGGDVSCHLLVLSGELPSTYLSLDPFLIVYFYSSLSSLSILYSLTSTSTGSISSDCDCYGHSHVM